MDFVKCVISSVFNLLKDEPNDVNLNVVEADLQIELSMEDRLFLDNGAQPKVKSILDANRCQMKLNISASGGHPDNSSVVISGPTDGVRHLPLSNTETSTITLKGMLKDVLKSSQELRQLLPITIWFDMHLNSEISDETIQEILNDFDLKLERVSVVLDPSTQPLQDIQKRYEMAVHVVPPQSPLITPTPMNHITVYIRTNRENEANLQPGIDALRDYIKANNLGHSERIVHTNMEFFSHRTDIVGRSYSQLEPIANKTSTQITVQKSGSNLNHAPNIAIARQDYSAVSAARSEISEEYVLEISLNVNKRRLTIDINVENSSIRVSRREFFKRLATPSPRATVLTGGEDVYSFPNTLRRYPNSANKKQTRTKRL